MTQKAIKALNMLRNHVRSLNMTIDALCVPSACDMHQAWRKKAERFIQHYIDSEKNSTPGSLNQIYAKGVFAGGSIGSVLSHAKELLKTDGHTTKFKDNAELEVRIVQLIKALKNHGSHHPNCGIYLSPPKHIRPCNCGFDEALNGSKELDMWSNIQIAFPFGHRYDCGLGTIGGCDCGLHDALVKLKENADE